MIVTVKLVLSAAASIGAGSIASQAIRSLSSAPSNLPLKICYAVGSVALGKAIANAAEVQVNNTVDSIGETISNLKSNDTDTETETV